MPSRHPEPGRAGKKHAAHRQVDKRLFKVGIELFGRRLVQERARGGVVLVTKSELAEVDIAVVERHLDAGTEAKVFVDLELVGILEPYVQGTQPGKALAVAGD